MRKIKLLSIPFLLIVISIAAMYKYERIVTVNGITKTIKIIEKNGKKEVWINGQKQPADFDSSSLIPTKEEIEQKRQMKAEKQRAKTERRQEKAKRKEEKQRRKEQQKQEKEERKAQQKMQKSKNKDYWK